MNAERLAEKLVQWIKDKVLAGGCKGVVVGISGGLDSSVLAVLCQRAFPESTLGVVMPCYSCQEDSEHARAVASKFSIPTINVVLDDIYDALFKKLPDYKGDTAVSHVAQANLKVRLRMLTLYYIANQRRYMVAGSGNRVSWRWATLPSMVTAGWILCPWAVW